MSQSVYFLQTQKDFYRLCEFVFEIQCKIYSYEGQPLTLEELKKWNKLEFFRILTSEEDVKLTKIGNRMIFSEESPFLEFSNCQLNVNTGEMEDGAIIYRHGEQALKAFKAIKKFIKANYRLADNKLTYVAEDFYQQWLERKVSVIYLLQEEEIRCCFPDGERRKFLTDLQDQGFVVTPFSDYRKEPDLDEDLAISLPDDHIKIEIRGSNIYVPSTEKCIFLFRHKKYDSLCLDKRLITEGEEIAKVFETLRSRLACFAL